MSTKLGSQGLAEWRENWTVVLAAALGVGLMSAVPYSVGVFIRPLEAEFGWKRAAISSGVMFNAVAAITLGAFVGLAVDRLGPRRIALVGSVMVCAGFILMSFTNASIWSWWSIWMFIALGAVLIKPMVWTAGVSSLFASSRGLALAATLCGTSLASTVTPVLATYLIGAFGWRTAYLGLSGFFAVLVLPALFFFFTSAMDRQRVRHTGQERHAPAADLAGDGAREGLTSFRFARLLLAALAISIVASTASINFVPILTSQGFSPMTAAGLAGLTGLSTIAGRLVGGVLLDRVNGNVVAAVSTAMPIFSCLLLVLAPGSVGAATAAALIVGLALGAELDAVAYLTTRHFGMRSFGVLFAVVGAGLSVTTATGPVALNAVFDATKSYDAAIWAAIPICILGSALFLSLGSYRFGAAGPATAPAEVPPLRPVPQEGG